LMQVARVRRRNVIREVVGAEDDELAGEGTAVNPKYEWIADVAVVHGRHWAHDRKRARGGPARPDHEDRRRRHRQCRHDDCDGAHVPWSDLRGRAHPESLAPTMPLEAARWRSGERTAQLRGSELPHAIAHADPCDEAELVAGEGRGREHVADVAHA